MTPDERAAIVWADHCEREHRRAIRFADERISKRAWLARAVLILLSAAISIVGIWLAILYSLGG